MRTQLYNYLNNLTTAILLVLAALTPLLFLNLTTNFFDMPKLALLVVTVVFLYGLWVLSWVVKGKVEITKTPLDIPLLVLLMAILASTFFSTSRYSSIFGAFPEVHGSAVSWVTYILLYFVTASHLRKPGQVKLFLLALVGSAVAVCLVSLFSYLGVYLPFEMAKSLNFTPTGSAFSTVAFLLMLMPVLLTSLVGHKNLSLPILATGVACLFSVIIVLTGSVSSCLVLLAIFAASLFVVRPKLSNKTLPLMLTPVAIAIFVFLLAYVPFAGNAIHEIRNNFPQEIQLPLDTSWKISATAFRDSPILGTGPATFLYNFTNYKPVEFNNLSFWNFTFSFAHNEFLQVLGTWGLVGLLALIAVCGVVIFFSKKYLASKHTGNSQEDDIHMLSSGLAVSGFVAVTLLLIHATTLVSIVITFFLLAALMMSQKDIREKVTEFAIGVKVATAGNTQIDLLPIVICVLYLVAALFVGRKTFSVVAADYYHRLALTRANKDGTKTYEYLQKAESLNPYIDLYRVDMAQTNFALANALASLKGPTKDNLEGTLSDQDKQTIQTLITQAISEGRASCVLSPRSSRNWEILAIIYRNITGVANNSTTFALDAYGRAIQMDPYNPALRVNAGAIYYASKNYDLAIRFYTDSINLKPDYINGYYNLAVALKDKGDLQNAKTIAEQAVAILQRDFASKDYKSVPETLKQTKNADYKTITDLLTSIKTAINAVATNQKEKEAAPGETTPLQNSSLPSITVPGLNNPPETTNPPVVEENPQVQLPVLSPVVSPAVTP
jgi:tetratricopeptide (TPR) repeat protein/O-antigen ligase